MATVKENVPIKYNIAKVSLNTVITIPVTYDVFYTKVNGILPNIADYGVLDWQSYGQVQINAFGNVTPEINLTGLEDFSYYIICFRKASDPSVVSYIRFKTGQNIALKESPYLDYTMFNDQSYTWFIDGVDQFMLPNKETEAVYYYYLRGNRKELLHENEEGGSWFGSFMPMIVDADSLTLRISYGERYNTIRYQNGAIDESYLLCDLTPHSHSEQEEACDFVACPCCKYDDALQELQMHEFWAFNDWGGGVSYYDLGETHTKFLLYIKSFTQEQTQHDRIICFLDNTLIPSDIKYSAWNRKEYICITSQGYLYKIVDGVRSANSSQALPFDTPLLVNIFQSTFQYMRPGDTQWISISGSYGFTSSTESPDENQRFSGKFPDFIGFGGCWDPTDIDSHLGPGSGYDSEGIYIGSFIWIRDTLDDPTNVYNKILLPSTATLKLRLTLTDSENNTYTEITPVANTTVVKSDRVTIVIPDILFAQDREIKEVLLELLSSNRVCARKTISGLQLGANGATSNADIKAFTSVRTRMMGAFDYDFPNMIPTVRMQKLRETFFTKHGTWGGYNGGVNGFNTYFSPEGYIRLENHGDRYKGALKGVGKEILRVGTESGYTGYGTDVDTSFEWDTRTNKQCLRTGTALVSNKYFGYGKIDVWWRIPKGTWGVCPAIWFFHYMEIGQDDTRFNQEPYMSRNRQGSAGDGYYRVVNNEIDIELPSHLTNGHCTRDELANNTYFDTAAIDAQLTIGLDEGDYTNAGLWKLKPGGINNPRLLSNYEKIADEWVGRCHGSFQNCKFNNWIGELNSGDGWIVGTQTDYDGIHQYGVSEDPQDKHKEEYLSQLTHLTDNEDGYADGQFHKWSIEWLPDRAVLYVDDVVRRVAKKFIPFNVMKLTIAGWFPTMKEVGDGVKDADGLYGPKGGIIHPSDEISPGTWAGNQANWEVCHIDISRIKWTPYAYGETVDTYDNDNNGNIVASQLTINQEPMYLGESFPESGLRYFEALANTSGTEIVGNLLFTNDSENDLVLNMQSGISQAYFKNIGNNKLILDLAALESVAGSNIQDDTDLEDMMALAFANRTTISAGEFSGLSKVSKVAFSPILTSIGDGAFNSLGSYETDYHVFQKCDLYFTGPCPIINENAFKYAELNNIYVPSRYVSDYQEAFNNTTANFVQIIGTNIDELDISINKNNIYKKIDGSNNWSIYGESVNFSTAWNYIHTNSPTPEPIKRTYYYSFNLINVTSFIFDGEEHSIEANGIYQYTSNHAHCSYTASKSNYKTVTGVASGVLEGQAITDVTIQLQPLLLLTLNINVQNATIATRVNDGAWSNSNPVECSAGDTVDYRVSKINYTTATGSYTFADDATENVTVNVTLQPIIEQNIENDTTRVINAILNIPGEKVVWTHTSDVHSQIANTSTLSPTDDYYIRRAIGAELKVVTGLQDDNTVNVICLVNTGDFVDRANVPDADSHTPDNLRAQILQFIDYHNNGVDIAKPGDSPELVAGVGIPCIVIPGNHDVTSWEKTNGTTTSGFEQSARFYMPYALGDNSVNTNVSLGGAGWTTYPKSANAFRVLDNQEIILAFYDFYDYKASPKLATDPSLYGDGTDPYWRKMTDDIAAVLSNHPTYKVVIFTHQSIYLEDRNAIDYDFWTNQDASAKSKLSCIDGRYSNNTPYIFTTLGSSILAVICGHKHSDVLKLTTCPISHATTMGLLHINDEIGDRRKYYDPINSGGYTAESTEIGTIGECSVNVYCYAKTQGKLYKFRIGAGPDEIFEGIGDANTVAVSSLGTASVVKSNLSSDILTEEEIWAVAVPPYFANDFDPTQLDGQLIYSGGYKLCVRLTETTISDVITLVNPDIPKGWSFVVVGMTINHNSGVVTSMHVDNNIRVVPSV